MSLLLDALPTIDPNDKSTLDRYTALFHNVAFPAGDEADVPTGRVYSMAKQAVDEALAGTLYLDCGAFVDLFALVYFEPGRLCLPWEVKQLPKVWSKEVAKRLVYVGACEYQRTNVNFLHSKGQWVVRLVGDEKSGLWIGNTPRGVLLQTLDEWLDCSSDMIAEAVEREFPDDRVAEAALLSEEWVCWGYLDESFHDEAPDKWTARQMIVYQRPRRRVRTRRYVVEQIESARKRVKK